jgi:hypothetical protein
MSGTQNHRGWGWIRKRGSGRYQASYIGPDRVRHYAPTTFEHKIEAEEWLTTERREIQNAQAAVRSTAVNHGSAGLQWMSPAQRQAVMYESLKSTGDAERVRNRVDQTTAPEATNPNPLHENL